LQVVVQSLILGISANPLDAFQGFPDAAPPHSFRKGLWADQGNRIKKRRGFTTEDTKNTKDEERD
jgi:hypothetical protein